MAESKKASLRAWLLRRSAVGKSPAQSFNGHRRARVCVNQRVAVRTENSEVADPIHLGAIGQRHLFAMVNLEDADTQPIE